MLLMIRSSSSHLLSTNNVSMPSASQRSLIHRRRDLVLFVASKIPIVLPGERNQLHMSLTAASAAALRSLSPSLLLLSKNEAFGCGVFVRRYDPTLKHRARMLSQPR